ncbi:methyltransferase domain-containing protein [Segatella copri]|uniref:Methyltransferase domain-containing protein n=1 Tax=Segatella copri TaxID=165179 RepID=A0A414YGL7_9BACT|nr:methyltransferase domain-containing protein [Segatella copri]RHH85317.1 methyltransferase domain-containing protein [Segatella copri]
MMTKLCIDFGSGYNPKTGYKTCDVTTLPQLDFLYDGKDEIVGLREKSVDVFYLRNVVHHIPDLQRTFTTLKKYLKVGGKLVIIDCNQGHYKTNVFLDNLWYRFVGNNHEIFISKQYRDYINVLIKLGFKQLYYKSFKEKEITKYECN